MMKVFASLLLHLICLSVELYCGRYILTLEVMKLNVFFGPVREELNYFAHIPV